MHKVDHIRVLTKRPCVSHRTGNGLELTLFKHILCLCGKIVQPVKDTAYLRKVDKAQCAFGIIIIIHACLDKIVDNYPADILCGHGGVGGYGIKPVGIIPAARRLQLLGGYHVVRMAVYHAGGLHRCHKAGVKADKVKGHSRLVKGCVDLVYLHGRAAVQLVYGIAVKRTAAVIPQDKGIAVCGEILAAVAYKFRKGVGVVHGLAAHILLNALYILRHYLPYLIGLIADNGVLPFLCAACVDKDIYLVRKLCFAHFKDIRGCCGAVRFKVSSAEIDHYGKAVVLPCYLDSCRSLVFGHYGFFGGCLGCGLCLFGGL